MLTEKEESLWCTNEDGGITLTFINKEQTLVRASKINLTKKDLLAMVDSIGGCPTANSFRRIQKHLGNNPLVEEVRKENLANQHCSAWLVYVNAFNKAYEVYEEEML